MFISRDVLYCQYFEKKNSCSPLEIQDFEETFSFSSRLNEILQTDSLLESQNFERKDSVLLSILPSISLPLPVRNHIFIVLLSNILTSVNKGTLVMLFSNTQSLFWNWTSEVLFVAEIVFRAEEK